MFIFSCSAFLFSFLRSVWAFEFSSSVVVFKYCFHVIFFWSPFWFVFTCNCGFPHGVSHNPLYFFCLFVQEFFFCTISFISLLNLSHPSLLFILIFFVTVCGLHYVVIVAVMVLWLVSFSLLFWVCRVHFDIFYFVLLCWRDKYVVYYGFFYVLSCPCSYCWCVLAGYILPLLWIHFELFCHRFVFVHFLVGHRN